MENEKFEIFQQFCNAKINLATEVGGKDKFCILFTKVFS